jgi:OmpA-OmpF porin, OOP family
MGFEENSELNHLAEELLENAEVKILISGHTDNVGAPDKNLKLSRERAEAVKAYLVYKGVDANRISCQGVGPREPIASNNTPEGRLKNRRVEFKILE